MGPPEKDGPGAPHDARPNPQQSDSSHAKPTGTNDIASGRQSAYDRLTGNARRYAASRRMSPIRPCGCIRDPDHDHHRCDGEISDVMAEAAALAVVHLDALGTPGLLDERTCRAMYRAGHRRLALDVHRRTAGAA